MNVFERIKNFFVLHGWQSSRVVWFLGAGVVVLIALCVAFFYSLTPPASAAFRPTTFTVTRGEGSREIASGLARAGLIQSETSFFLYAVFSGAVLHFHDGAYYISAPASVPDLVGRLSGTKKEVTVRIPDGSAVRDADAILMGSGIIPPGSLVALDRTRHLEGHLFPDTYNFYVDSAAVDVTAKIFSNFNERAAPILAKDPTHLEENLILASLIEKEVPDFHDQQIVAGILKKRITAGIPLQLDATVCYAKTQTLLTGSSCYPLSPSDFLIDSPYNTYHTKGLPPGPIASPGISAIQAAMTPQSSPYWYYLSDPKTGKTIFAKNLDEQNAHRMIYLK